MKGSPVEMQETSQFEVKPPHDGKVVEPNDAEDILPDLAKSQERPRRARVPVIVSAAKKPVGCHRVQDEDYSLTDEERRRYSIEAQLLVAHKRVEDYIFAGLEVPPEAVANLEKAIAAVE